MKKVSLAVALLFLTTSAFAQEQLTIFYFGATNCPPCNQPKVIQSINKLEAEFDSVYTDFNTKFVMVVFDEKISTGLKFIKKYNFWDEISIGSRYQNELALTNLNKTDIPGLPHILIYKESFENVGDYGIEVRKNKELIKEIFGGTNIVSWVNSGMKLE